MANPETPWWTHEALDPRHFYAAYSFDSAENRQNDVMAVVEEAKRLGYPVRYWWLSDAMDLQGSPDRLIVCVHHPTSGENAGMDLYRALEERHTSWDDLEAASVDEYRQYSRPIEGPGGISGPDGTSLFPSPTMEAVPHLGQPTPAMEQAEEPETDIPPTTFLVYYTLYGLMLVDAANAQAANQWAAGTLHAVIGKMDKVGVTAREVSHLGLGQMEIHVDSVEALEFPADVAPLPPDTSGDDMNPPVAPPPE